MTAADIAVAEGYTVPAAGPSIRRRVWRLRFPLLILALLMVTLVLTFVNLNPQSTATLSMRNPGPDGAMATGEILRRQGVSISEVSYLARARILDPATTTLAITLPSNLAGPQIDSVLDYPGDIVFVGVDQTLVYLASAKLDGGLDFKLGSDAVVESANCRDPDAIAAGTTTAEGPWVHAQQGSTTTVCFAGSGGYGTYAVIEHAGHRIILITDPTIAMNRSLASEGNAALVLRALGVHRHLVWYVPAIDDTTVFNLPGTPATPSNGPVHANLGQVPPGTVNALWILAGAGLVAALWRARRMGALVTEALPIAVHASESTRGRGRLYRRAHAYGRASAALRAAAAERMGRRLGVPRSADAAALTAAVARVTGRDAAAVERLLYGPPPTAEAAMMDLAHELDALEKEVRRP